MKKYLKYKVIVITQEGTEVYTLLSTPEEIRQRVRAILDEDGVKLVGIKIA